ncbi:MAG TPA: hypothetical protein VEZ42_06280 [Pseudonocardia sp.]|nr:hypothetical protein [Pseudonocardia sp.]
MSRIPRIRPTGAAVAGAMIGVVVLAGCGAGQIAQTAEQVAAVGGVSGNAGPIAVRDASIEFAEDAEGADLYPVGGSAPLQMSIANSGQRTDRLVSATSPAASSVQISGNAEIPPGQVVVVEGAPLEDAGPGLAPTGSRAPGAVNPAPTAGAQPTAPVEPTVAPTGPPSPADEAPPVTGDPREGGFDPAGPGQGTDLQPGAVDQGIQVVLTGLREEVRAGLTYPVVLTFEQAGEVSIEVPVANSTATREAEPEE